MEKTIMNFKDYFKRKFSFNGNEEHMTKKDYEVIYCELALAYIDTVKSKVGKLEPIFCKDSFIFFEGLRHSICVLLELESCAAHTLISKYEQDFVLAMRDVYHRYHIDRLCREERQRLLQFCVVKMTRDYNKVVNRRSMP